MTAIGILVAAAGVSLIWGGITNRSIIPEVRAALGNKKPGATGPGSGATAKVMRSLNTDKSPVGGAAGTTVGAAGPLGPQGPNGPVG